MPSDRRIRALKNFSLMAVVVLACAGPIHAQSGAEGRPLADGKAVFEKRVDTMKHMGRPFYLGIGRVVKGRAPYGPDTVAAAETVAAIANKLDAALFQRGSDLAESRLEPEIFSAGARVDQLIAAVQQTTAQLVTAVKIGDKTRIAFAYGAVNNACNACHSRFRKEG
jgi:cytochrome c556